MTRAETSHHVSELYRRKAATGAHAYGWKPTERKASWATIRVQTLVTPTPAPGTPTDTNNLV
jgi:hypothetical protein